MNLRQQIHIQLFALLNRTPPSEAGLNNALRLLAKYRSTLIQNTLVRQCGAKVIDGPFAGMEFIEQSAEGCHVPKLVGCYEAELHPFLNTLAQENYTTVLNIVCAEGYYAVGIKRLLPAVRLLAYDINPRAQQACQALAARNGVNVEIGGLFSPQDFARFDKNEKILVWCDIEGAERELLDPELAPRLKEMDMVIEFHPTEKGHTFNDVLPRFAGSHDIEIIHARGHNPTFPPFLQQLGHLDQLLAQWEWRSAPTPWAILRTKA